MSPYLRVFTTGSQDKHHPGEARGQGTDFVHCPLHTLRDSGLGFTRQQQCSRHPALYNGGTTTLDP